MHAMNDRGPLADAIFRPRAIALIGATADQTKNNARAQRVLKKSGYGGRILPINPKAVEIALGALEALQSIAQQLEPS